MNIIKDTEAERLANELAELSGESLRAAVTEAVRERLQLVRDRSGAGMAERLLAIGRNVAPRLSDPYRSADHVEILYEQRGLPACSSRSSSVTRPIQ